jgi:hypothetical protein
MSCTELLLIAGSRNEPGEERSVFDQRLPPRDVPIHVLGGWHSGAWLAAEKNDYSIGFGWDETEKEDVLSPTVVAFEYRVSERAARMKLYFLVSRADQVIDDVGGGSITAGTAEPLAAGETSHNAARIVYATISVISSVAVSQIILHHKHTRRHVEAIPSLLQAFGVGLRRRFGGSQGFPYHPLQETRIHRRHVVFFLGLSPGSRYSRPGQQSRYHR